MADKSILWQCCVGNGGKRMLHDLLNETNLSVVKLGEMGSAGVNKGRTERKNPSVSTVQGQQVHQDYHRIHYNNNNNHLFIYSW